MKRERRAPRLKKRPLEILFASQHDNANNDGTTKTSRHKSPTSLTIFYLRILIILARLKVVDGPSEASTAVYVVPSRCHLVENGLDERQPLRLVLRRIGERVLGRRHGRESPEADVVVGGCSGLVGGHEISGLRCLMYDGL